MTVGSREATCHSLATQILITREFDAPRELVCEGVDDARARSALVDSRTAASMTVCEIDLRVGGTWRYAM